VHRSLNTSLTSLPHLGPGAHLAACASSTAMSGDQDIKLTTKEAADANKVLDIRAADAVLGPARDAQVAALSIDPPRDSVESKGIAGSFCVTLEPVDAIAPAFRALGQSAHARLFGDNWAEANAELSANGDDDSGGPSDAESA
jgi:hypothetical protein